MDFRISAILFTCISLFSTTLWSAGEAVQLGEDRVDFGFTGYGGGNLEAYSKNYPGREGEFRFVYGSDSSYGKVQYIHYNGNGFVYKMVLDHKGRLGLNTGSVVPCSTCQLAVNGEIMATSIKVESSISANEVNISTDQWADYVLHKDYELMPLEVLDNFIQEQGHLPGVPTTAEIRKEGVNVSQMTKTLLEKVEELTLHVIELKRENEKMKTKLSEFDKERYHKEN